MKPLYSDKVIEHFRHPKNMGEMKAPDGVATVGNPVCVIPETLVMGSGKAISIDKIKIGGKVLSHDGFFREVVKVHKRPYQGKIFGLRVHNLGEVWITPEHHILSAKTSKFSHKFVAFKKGKFILDWNRVDGLEKGDFIAYPIPQEVKDKNELKIDIPKPRWDFTSKNLPEKISVNKNFLRLVGYYLTEGYARVQRSKGTVGFVFGEHENEYVSDVIFLMRDIFGFSPSAVYKGNNSTSLMFYSARLARFFTKLFGKGALFKQVPYWIMTLPLEKQKALLCGLWRGDGYINSKKKTSKFVTISPLLANQVKLLLLRQEIVFSFLTSPAKGMHKEHYSFYVKDEDSLIKLGRIIGINFSFRKKIKNPKKSWFTDDFYYTSIWKIKEKQYKGLVFNLEVDKVQSYAVNTATLHNCGDVMRVFIKVGKHGKTEYLQDIKFQTLGCAAAIAVSSMLTTLAKGKPLKEAEKITRQQVAEALGGLPPIKMHCSVLIIEGLRKAIKDYRRKSAKH